MLRLLGMAAICAGATTMAACEDDLTPPPGDPPVIWEAELSPQGDASVTGSAEISAEAGELVANIAISGASEGDEFIWFAGEGAECVSEELRLGEAADYPALEAGEDGTASAEATVETDLDAEEEYHVAVISAGEESAVVACGELQPDV